MCVCVIYHTLSEKGYLSETSIKGNIRQGSGAAAVSQCSVCTSAPLGGGERRESSRGVVFFPASFFYPSRVKRREPRHQTERWLLIPANAHPQADANGAPAAAAATPTGAATGEAAAAGAPTAEGGEKKLSKVRPGCCRFFFACWCCSRKEVEFPLLI